MQRLAELPITVHLPDRPKDNLLWRAYGVAAYHRGYRPEPKERFERIVQVYNHSSTFIAPSMRSPRCADSRPVQVLITCLPMPSRYSPTHGQALQSGSGKTKWGHCWTKTSHLGYLTSARGSFAALRDLAGYGGYHALR